MTTNEGRIGTAKPLDHREWGEIGAYRRGVDWFDNSVAAVAARLRRWLELERRVEATLRADHPNRVAPETLARLELLAGDPA
jgi:hypothetical protein